MSVVNEALINLQKRRAEVIAARAESLDGKSAILAFATVRSWAQQLPEKEKNSAWFFISVVVVFLFLIKIAVSFFNHDASALPLKVQLSPSFNQQEIKGSLDDLSTLEHLTTWKLPDLPQLPTIKGSGSTRHSTSTAVQTAVKSYPQTVYVQRHSWVKSVYQIQDEIDHAMDLAQSRGYASAKQFLLNLMNKNPQQPEYADALIKLMANNNNWEEALPILKTARQQFPEDDGFRLMEARYYVSKKQWVKANDSLSDHPNLSQVEYLSLLAMIKKEMKDWKASNELYLKLHQMDLENPAWQLGLGLTYEELSDWPEAYKAFSAAQNSTGLSAETYRFLRQKLENWHH